MLSTADYEHGDLGVLCKLPYSVLHILHACFNRLAAMPSKPSSSSVVTNSQYVSWHDLTPVTNTVPKSSNLKYPIRFGTNKATWGTMHKLHFSSLHTALVASAD